jgi:DUF4097 and DUF4098 domain-containing protein YvlB
VHVRNVTGKAVVGTSGGGIEVTDVQGAIEASTSGGSIQASLPSQPPGDCTLKTSGGSITISLSEQVRLNVDARTSGGRVVTDLPVVSLVQGEQKRNVLQGKINDGGPLLTAHTSGGSVHLKKR